MSFPSSTRLDKTLDQQGDLLRGGEVHPFKGENLVQSRTAALSGRDGEALISIETNQSALCGTVSPSGEEFL